MPIPLAALASDGNGKYSSETTTYAKALEFKQI